MRYGPFPPRDVSVIEDCLKSFKISYEIVKDPSQVLAELNARKDLPPSRIPYPPIDPACFYFEINEYDVERLGGKLAKFGIEFTRFEPDLSAEDYYCPLCGYYSPVRGVCPKHQVSLIPSEAYKNFSQNKESDRLRKAWRWFLIVIGLVALISLIFFGKIPPR